MSSKKKVEKAGKARNSVTQLVRRKIQGGSTNVDTILDAIHKEFPKAKATPGYVRHIARHVVGKALPYEGRKTKVVKPKKTKPAKPAKAAASESQAAA